MFISTKPRNAMKGYSRSKSDFREKLIQKYVRNTSLYRNQKSMKECVLISMNDCVKCRYIKPHLEKWCKENGYKFKEMEYGPGMDEVTSVPCAMIGNDVILDNEGIIELITNKKSFY